MALQQGSIVWVNVSDQSDRNPKCRPAVVVTPTAEISPEETIVVVAATSTFSLPLPANLVELPWHRNRHRETGLYQRCVAVCDWLIEIQQTAIVDAAGITPPAVLQRILSKIPRIDDPEELNDRQQTSR